MKTINPIRGEVWIVNFEPIVGHEIMKARPATVVSLDAVGSAGLRVVLPVTTNQPKHDGFPWCVPIVPTDRNGLERKSTADAVQIKCASVQRFISRLGAVSDGTLSDVCAAIGLVIGL